MLIKRPQNTKKSGAMELLVYKDGDKFIGVCLTFDIVEEGENPIELMKSIREAAELHLQTVINANLPDELLNRYAPEEYWEKYFSVAKSISSASSTSTDNLVVSPYYGSLTPQIA